ncbi:MAG: uracil-DNA glycosylase [Candidatus Moraniibacteriota bacterium]|nr:MAG: uracil-DNA glycosylase [Candidatus Moranbacteria bacterium]
MAESCECELRKTATNVVPGVGNASASIVFIGEAPGKKEDETGEPFVGAAGKFLNEMLESIQMSRNDIYITNVVKYRPPNNRDPLPDEVAACWPWLRAQLEVIDPRLIILLGKHALERFVPGKRISVEHGRAFRRTVPELGTFVFFALYHPAAALYNGSMRETLLRDFRRIPKLLELLRKEEGGGTSSPSHF